MRCHNCGQLLQEGEKQCFHCGALQAPPSHKKRPVHAAKPSQKGPGTKTLFGILIFLLVTALIIWGLVYLSRQPKDPENSTSSEEASAVTMQVSGELLGQKEEWNILLVENKDLFLCSTLTGEAQRICGMSDKGKAILSAAYCHNFIYFVEQSEQYNYLYRVAPSGESVVEKLRLNAEGNQMRTQIGQLFSVNGKLCGFARYPRVEGVSEAYVELYQLNSEGVYKTSDATTKILYTTQNNAEAKDLDPALYTVEATESGLLVRYNGEEVSTCTVE